MHLTCLCIINHVFLLYNSLLRGTTSKSLWTKIHTGSTWRWVNDRIITFGRTIPLKCKQMLRTCSLRKHLQTRPSVVQIHCCFVQLFQFSLKRCRSQRGVCSSLPKTTGALCGLGDGVILWTNRLPHCTFLMHHLVAVQVWKKEREKHPPLPYKRPMPKTWAIH